MVCAEGCERPKLQRAQKGVRLTLLGLLAWLEGWGEGAKRAKEQGPNVCGRQNQVSPSGSLCYLPSVGSKLSPIHIRRGKRWKPPRLEQRLQQAGSCNAFAAHVQGEQWVRCEIFSYNTIQLVNNPEPLKSTLLSRV